MLRLLSLVFSVRLVTAWSLACILGEFGVWMLSPTLREAFESFCGGNGAILARRCLGSATGQFGRCSTRTSFRWTSPSTRLSCWRLPVIGWWGVPVLCCERCMIIRNYMMLRLLSVHELWKKIKVKMTKSYLSWTLDWQVQFTVLSTKRVD